MENEAKKPTIVIGADHGGFKKKEALKRWLAEAGYAVEDKGSFLLDPGDDYPPIALSVAREIAGDSLRRRGILLCRTGEGMDIAANKVRGIRASVGWNEEIAQRSREHNDANIVTLAADYQTLEQMQNVLSVWLEAGFPEVQNGERHERRVKQIEEIENKTMK